MIQTPENNNAILSENTRLKQKVKELEAKISDAPLANLFLNSIIENIPDMIFVKDAKELRFVRFNRAGEELLGFQREELIGKNDYDFFPKEQADHFTQLDHEVLAGKKTVDILEEPIQTRFKGRRILHTKKVPLYDQNGQPAYLLGISEDITDKKLAQDKLMQKTEQLTRSQAELDQLELFAFAATHDLQEPLRKILIHADLLQTRASDQLTQEAMRWVNRIVAGSSGMQHMMQELQELSHIGAAEISFESVALGQIVSEVLDHFKDELSSQNVEVTVDTLPVIQASPLQMKQLFKNLISNAIKFRKADQPLKISVKSHSTSDDMVSVSIEDNGIGFDEKYLESIFKPFQRLHGRSYPGSGIGLTICRKIMLRHHGQLHVTSRPGYGSCFTVEFPKDRDKTS